MSNLYHVIAADLARGIEAGIYKIGEKLPGIRATSEDKGVSAATAVAAYRQLELDGYIEARPRSGFFVLPRKRPLPEPATRPVLQKRPRLVSSQEWILSLIEDSWNPAMVNFGSAVADDSFLPTVLLEKSLRKAARMHRQCVANYAFPFGAEALREQLAKRMTSIGCFTRMDEIVVTNGCQEAIVIALKLLTQPGDTIALESPTYHGHLQAAESLGLKVLEIPSLPGKGMALEALQLALDKWPIKACLVIPNFSNPLGASMPEKNKRKLINMLARQQVPLIEDDIYGDLSFDQQRPSTLKSLDKSGNNIYCSSFSKSLSPGLRVGWMIAGKHQRQAIYQKFITSVATNSIGQLVAADMLASGQYLRHVRQLRSALSQAVLQVSNLIAESFPPGTKITKPRGGYVVWVELPEGVDALELAELARQQGISIAPGPMFSASGKYRQFMRISCAVQWNERTRQGLTKLAALTQSCQRQAFS